MKIRHLGTRATGARTLAFALAAPLALALAGALALGGCASQTSDSAALAGSEAATDSSDLSGELTVYAAASLKTAFDALTEGFAAEHPGVTFAPIVYDGSSTLAAQLVAGAPADVFAAADEPSMQTVVDEGLIAGDAPVFAANVLVIAVAQGNPLGITSLADLTESNDGEAPIVVMCAARVPCGNASSALLRSAEVELKPSSEEQNVSAVFAKVRAREADAGLVYRTDVLGAGGAVDGVEIVGSEDHPNRYPIGVLAGSAHAEAAQAFSEYVRSATGQAKLAQFGFGAP